MYMYKNPRKIFGYIFPAMFVACAMYILCGYLMTMVPKTVPITKGIEIARIILLVMAIGSICAGVVWLRNTITEEKLKQKESKQAAMQLVLNNCIISLALIESVPIYGVFWLAITFQFKHLPYASGLAMLIMLLLRPQMIAGFDKAEQLFPMDK